MQRAAVLFQKGSAKAGGYDPDEVAWIGRNSGARTHPVGLLKANELRLYDMSGNVWEWCMDPWRDYGADLEDDMHTRPYPAYRVSRGGSWLADPMFARVSARSGDPKSSRSHVGGFRIAVYRCYRWLCPV